MEQHFYLELQQLPVMVKGNKIRNVVVDNNKNVAEMTRNNVVLNKIDQNVKMSVRFVKQIFVSL